MSSSSMGDPALKIRWAVIEEGTQYQALVSACTITYTHAHTMHKYTGKYLEMFILCEHV